MGKRHSWTALILSLFLVACDHHGNDIADPGPNQNSSPTETPIATEPSVEADAPTETDTTTGTDAQPSDEAQPQAESSDDLEQVQESCPSEIVVWVNTRSGIYHMPRERWYGATESGTYMCQAAADGEGDRETMNGQ